MRCECGNHDWKTITKGFVIVVSPEDADLLTLDWYATTDGRGHIYARRNIPCEGGPRKQELLHRAIVKPASYLVVDHRNSNGLDNHRCNLRACTKGQNCLNARPWRNKQVPLKGVGRASKNSFHAKIKKNKRLYWLGSFPTAEAAHAAYVAASKALHGEFGRAE